MALSRPRALRPGATLALASPAFTPDAEAVDAGQAALEAAGFRVVRRPDLLAVHGYLAGDDARRLDELESWVRDPEVDAILCTRGGYGTHRIAADLDLGLFRRERKAVLGYSDITTLHLHLLRNAELTSLHAPMLDHGAPLPEELAALRDWLEGREVAPFTGEARGAGKTVEGRLVGGSLTLLAASLGTPWELQTDGAILLFEEVNEKPYAIDRSLQQLRAAGKLDGVVGVGIGHLAGCEDPRRPEPSAEAVIQSILEPLGVPLVFGLPFGHMHPNLPWPVGVRGRLDGARGELDWLERGVE